MIYFPIVVLRAIVDPTQVHIQVIISRYSLYIDYFLGIAWARLERSTLPDHKGTRTVVLRFLKIIKPVKCVVPLYDGHISVPKDGELHKKSRRIGSQKVWSANIDKSTGPSSMGPGFQLLWDA
jgi:hypothetical protein